MAHDETKSVPSRSQPGDKVRVKHGVRDPDFLDSPWAAGRGRSRRSPRRERRARPNDDLVEAAESFLPRIRRLYRRFEDKQPVMLLELPSLRLYAYPYREFKADLSERSQAMLEDESERAVAEGKIIVFMGDDQSRRLVSMTFETE